MRATSYLLLTSLKNRILSLKKKPALAIFYGICVAFIVFLLVVYSLLGPEEKESFGDIGIVYVIIAGLGGLLLYMSVITGISTGGTLFTMPDVNLLFVAPVSSKRVLVYGLIKQMGTTLLAAVFIVFQIPNLKMNFDIDAFDIANLFIIYTVIVFLSQIISMAVYLFTNGNENRKRLVKGACFAALLALAAVIFARYRQTGNLWEGIKEVIDSKGFGFVPVMGWSVMFVKAGMEGNMLFYVLALAFFVAVSAAVVLAFTSGNADYYEDVLLSTETNFITMQAAKEGKQTGIKTNKKVKIKEGRTGIGRGRGADVLFWRHVLELKRSSFIPFINTYTLLAAVFAGIFAYMSKENFAGYIILIILAYIQFFITVMGKLVTELNRPYIYLIPQSSLKKLVYASMSSIIKPFIDGAVVFAVVAVAGGADIITAVFQMLAYGVTGLIFTSFAVVCQRVLGGQPNKVLSAFIGMLLFFVMVMPGAGLSIAAFILLPEGLKCICLLPYITLCLLVSMLVFVLCRNIFDHMG